MQSGSGPRGDPWWKNPFITVPAIAAVIAAIVGAIVTASLQSPSNLQPSVSSDGTSPSAQTPTETPNLPSQSTGLGQSTNLPAPEIRRQGFINVAPNSTYDLDSTSPGWDQGSLDTENDIAGYGGPPVDIFINPNPAYVKLQPTDPGTYATCSNATGYQSNQVVDHGDISSGDRWCLRTGEGRYCLIIFESVNPYAIQIHVDVWQKQ
jgi:hypothetical protein